MDDLQLSVAERKAVVAVIEAQRPRHGGEFRTLLDHAHHKLTHPSLAPAGDDDDEVVAVKAWARITRQFLSTHELEHLTGVTVTARMEFVVFGDRLFGRTAADAWFEYRP